MTATDINEAMMEVARTMIGSDPRVTFAKADACELPFADKSFDVLACQFGVMFFPDKVRAMQEARRVLAPEGRYIFNVFAVAKVLAKRFGVRPCRSTMRAVVATAG